MPIENPTEWISKKNSSKENAKNDEIKEIGKPELKETPEVRMYDLIKLLESCQKYGDDIEGDDAVMGEYIKIGKRPLSLTEEDKKNGVKNAHLFLNAQQNDTYLSIHKDFINGDFSDYEYSGDYAWEKKLSIKNYKYQPNTNNVLVEPNVEEDLTNNPTRFSEVINNFEKRITTNHELRKAKYEQKVNQIQQKKKDIDKKYSMNAEQELDEKLNTMA